MDIFSNGNSFGLGGPDQPRPQRGILTEVFTAGGSIVQSMGNAL